MPDRSKSDQLLGGVVWILAAKGGHWLITPARHPDATTLQYLWAWGELIICGIAGWRLLKGTQPPASTP